MRWLILLLALFATAPARAGDLALRVLDSSGHPVENAVVSLSNGNARPAHVSGRYVMAQQGMAFRPFVLVVPVGAKVAFPNLDPTRHHVYSFSPTKKFELKLFAKDQSRSVTFDRPGVVALGCNIHDAMSAFIYVTASDWTAKTDARGVAVIAGAPASGGVLTVWHPYLRSPQGTMQLNIRPGQHAANVAVRLRPPMRMDHGY